MPDAIDRPNARRYVAELLAAWSDALGRPIEPGTTVVPFADRADSPTSVAYLLPGHTLVACGQHLRLRLVPLDGAEVLDEATFVDRLGSDGGRLVGAGVNRVLDGPPIDPGADMAQFERRWLDRDDADDLALLTTFVEEVPDDDLEEAELSLDDLDPAILVFVDRTGRIAAYASGRPWQFGHGFDDIGVVVHPEYRRRGLGAQVVHDFAVARHPVGPQLYRHDADNEGSSRLSASLGFGEVHRVVAVELGSS